VFSDDVLKFVLLFFFRAKLIKLYHGPIQVKTFSQDWRCVLLPSPEHRDVFLKFTLNNLSNHVFRKFRQLLQAQGYNLLEKRKNFIRFTLEVIFTLPQTSLKNTWLEVIDWMY